MKAVQIDRSLIPSLVVCDLLDGESKWISCDGKRFPVTRCGDVVYTSRGHVVNVLKDHKLTMEGNVMTTLKGSFYRAYPWDVAAHYDRRWFLTSYDEVRNLRGIATADYMAQYAWRESCMSMAVKLDSVQNQVDVRMMLFPALDVDLDFVTRRTLAVADRLVRRHQFLAYVKSEEKSMMMLGMTVEESFSRSMACFSACVDSLSSVIGRTDVSGGESSVVDDIAGHNGALGLGLPDCGGADCVDNSVVDEESAVRFYFGSGFRGSDPGGGHSRGDVTLFSGCVRCCDCFGVYNCITKVFRPRGGGLLGPLSLRRCDGCPFDSLCAGVEPGGLRSGWDIVLLAVRQLAIYLPRIDVVDPFVGLLTVGDNGLCFVFSSVPSRVVPVSRVGAAGVWHSYCYHRDYTSFRGVTDVVQARLGVVRTVFCVVVYHDLFSCGSVYVMGNDVRFRFANGSDYIRGVLDSGQVSSRYGAIAYLFDADVVLVRVTRSGYVIDTGWMKDWLFMKEAFGWYNTEFYLMYEDPPYSGVEELVLRD